MRTAIALLLLSGCARTGYYTQSWYEDCMKRLEAPEKGDIEWREIDALCRKRARQLQYEGPQQTVICRDGSDGKRICETYDNR